MDADQPDRPDAFLNPAFITVLFSLSFEKSFLFFNRKNFNPTFGW
jgi:hypothetical protein